MVQGYCAGCSYCQRPICEPGLYGQACNETCDRNCRVLACPSCTCDVCDRISGKCMNGCDAGWYGKTCSQICPENCFQEGLISVQCDQDNGTCIFGCGKGYYGNRCNESCSEKCLNLLCEQKTGYCSQGCIHGFEGFHCNEETGGMAADQLAGAVGGAFVVILWGVIVIILICFIYRRRQREYDYLPRNDSLRSRSHRSSSRRPLHRKESTSSQGGTLVPLDPECNDCNEIVQEIQAIEDFHSAHSRQPSFKHRHFHRSTDYIIDSSPVFDCPLVYGCHPVLVQECPDRSPAPSRRLRDDLATSRILIPADSIEEEPVEDIEVLRVSPPRKFSTDFRPLPSPSISKNDQEPKP